MRSRIKSLAAATLSLALTVGMPAGTALAKGNLPRLGGSTRYDTMSQIVNEAFNTSNFAVVATGENFPDALAASALAGAKNCPIILTQGTQLTPQARQRLRSLNVSYAYVIGGKSSISDDVFDAVGSTVSNVKRIDGDTRIETSINVLKETILNDANHSRTVFVASGSNFADALSISPYCYKTKSPIVLANSTGTLSGEAIDAIKNGGFNEVVVLGGDKAVNFKKVKEQLEAVIKDTSLTIDRQSGSDRYDTCKKIVAWERNRGMQLDNVAIATGQNYPDALVGSALCGKKNSVMILTDNWTSANLEIITANNNAFQIQNGYILGGEKSVSNATESSIAKAMEESTYFTRINSKGEELRFKLVRVILVSGEEIGSQEVVPTDNAVTLYSNQNAPVSVEYGSVGSSTYTKIRNIKTIHLYGSGNDLLVSFNGGDKVKLNNCITAADSNGGIGEVRLTIS